MERLRIGVMGCADFAWRAMIPAMLQCNEIELVAVASRSPDKAARFANQFSCNAIVGYDEILERNDVDAIYMPLPTGLHEQWIPKSVTAQKHVLVEKSFAENYESAKAMIALAKEKRILIMENFLFPHHSQHTWVQQKIAQGEIGDIRLFRSTFGFPPLARNNYRYSRNLGGGALLDAGAYTIKASTLFLGNELTLLGSELEYDNELKVDIFGDAMLTNSNGQIAQVSFGFNYYYQCFYELLGTAGKLTVERAFTPPPGFNPVVRLERQNHVQKFILPPDNHYVNMLRNFAKVSKNDLDFSPYYEEILIQAQLLDRIRINNFS